MQETLELPEKIRKILTIPTHHKCHPTGAAVLVAQDVRALSQLLSTLNVKRQIKNNCANIMAKLSRREFLA